MYMTARAFAAPCLLALLALVPLTSRGQSTAATEQMTPLLLAVHDAPVPFNGSDGRTRLVYELAMTNFSSGDLSVQKVEVLGDGALLQTLDAAALATRLQAAGMRDSAATLPKSTHALLFLDIILPQGAAIPRELSHRVAVLASAAPPDRRNISETGGAIAVDQQPVVQIGPPLRGAGYISADSCCDATRHTRAAMPVNGRVWISQRYAVDWEQLNAAGRIYSGPQQKLESYAIFGQPALAVADAVVESVIDNQPEQTPGKFPTNIPLADADGNCVILDLGGHRYALYAHLQPGSIKVHRGDRVKLGQVLGLVGDSGNSIVPHLHFQVTAGPSSMASNGLPYEIRDFQVTGKVPGTAAFDKSETDGSPLPFTPITPPQSIKNALPLDQYIISFPAN
jgi:murein DD-endopeptidase MepM/ murein hydrolase activator NlpD